MARKSGTYVLAPSKRSAAQKKQVAQDTARHNAAVQRRQAKLHANALARREAAKYPRDPGARKVLSKPARKKAERTATRYNKGNTEKYEQGQRNKAVAQLVTGKRRMKYGHELDWTPATKGPVPVKKDIRDTTKNTGSERKAIDIHLSKQKTKGDKILDVLDDVYKVGDKAVSSVGPGIRKVLENVPTLKLDPQKAIHNKGGSVSVRKSTKKESKGQTKALGKVATSPLKASGLAAKGVAEGAKVVSRQTRVAKAKGGKQVAALPGGKTVLAAGGIGAKPFTVPFEGAKKGAKALWYSDEAIKAAATGKNVLKASQGKVKTSGQEVNKSLGIDPKKHKGAAILAGGATDLLAQAPLAAFTGGEGSIAKMAAKEAAETAGKAATKAELKAAGVKKVSELDEAAKARIEGQRHKAAENAHAHATAKYGKQHDINVGIDVKVPFSNKRLRKVKGVKQSTGLAKATTEGRKVLDATELKGGVKGKVVTKARNATNTAHTAFNAKAGSRFQSGHSVSATQHAGAITRGRTEIHEKDARDFEHSLNSLKKYYEKEGKDWPTELERILTEVEQHGPKAPSAEARHLHAVQEAPHKKLVDEGLDSPFAGQRHTPYDGGTVVRGKNNAAKKDADKITTSRRTAGAEVRTQRLIADAARRDPQVGVKVRKATEEEQAWVDSLKEHEKLAKGSVKVHESRVSVLEKRHRQLGNRLKVLARTTPHGKSPAQLIARQAEAQAVIERQRIVETALKRVYEKKPQAAKLNLKEASIARREAEAALDASTRSATKGRVSRPYNEAELAAMENAHARHAVEKGYEQRRIELVREIKAHPGTENLKETHALYDKWIKEANKIGAKNIAKKFEKLKAEKAATPAFYVPRPKVKVETESLGEAPVWSRNTSQKVAARHSREDRTKSAAQAMAERTPEGGATHDFSIENLANNIKRDNIDAERSRFWSTIRDTVEDESTRVITHTVKDGKKLPAKGGAWYVIDKRGPSKALNFESDAKKLKKNKDEAFDPDAKIVYLTDRTKKLIEREAQPNRRGLDENGVIRRLANAQGIVRKVAVSTLFNRMQNAVGDTTRAIIYGGRLKHMLAAGKLAGPKGIVSKEASLARSEKRWLENVELHDGVPLSERAKKLRNTRIPGGTRTYGDYFDEIRRNGVYETGLIRGDVEDNVITSKGVRSAKTGVGKVGDKWIRMVSTLESWPRTMAYISAREAGLTEKQALEASNHALFDYTRRSSVEGALTRTVMPFIIWRGRNATTLAAYYARKPGKIKQHITIFNTLAQEAGYDSMSALMEDLGEFTWNLPIPVPGTKGGTVSVGIPAGDVNQIYEQVKNGAGYEAAYSNVFGGKLLAAIATRGRGEAGSEYSQPAGLLGKAKGVPGLEQLLGIHAGEDIAGEKKTMLGAIPSAAMGLTPETALLQRVTSGRSKQDRVLALTKFGTGVAYNPRRPKQGEIDRTTRRIKRIEIELVGSPPAERRKALYKEKFALSAKRKKLYAEQDKALGRKSKKPAASGRGGSRGPFDGGGNPFNSGSGPFSGSANPFK